MVRIQTNKSSDLWEFTCTKCGNKHSWKSPKAPIPACPKCKAPAGFGARAVAILAVKVTGKRPSELADDAEELFEEIEDLHTQVPERGEDFAFDVFEKSKDILKNVREHNRATSDQVTALTNMRDGLSRWIN